MLRRAKNLAGLMLAFTLIVSGCGRYAETVEKPAGEKPVATETPKLSVETPAPQKEPEPRELVPFAESRDFERLYGYMDQAGNIVIEPRFGSAEPFYACGLAIAGDANGKLGLIDRSGKFVVSPEANIITYSDGVFIALIYDGNRRARAYDENGAFLFEQADWIYQFSDGLSKISANGKSGYIDKTGKIVLEVPYKNTGEFCDGIAEVAMEYGGPSVLIDKQGNDLTEKVSSGLRMIKDAQTGLFGYEDTSGKRVIEPRFITASPFRDGLAIVGVEGGTYDEYLVYGIIDTQGNYVLEPEYISIRRMRNGSFAVGEKLPEDAFFPSMYVEYCKKALFSKDLKQHTDWVFLELDDLDASYTCVSDGKKIYYLDARLNRAADLPEFEGRGLMLADGSLLRGTINEQLTVAERSGKILSKDEKLTLLEGGIKARFVTQYPHDYTTIIYPILEGLEDAWIEEQLNRFIQQEAESYVSFDGTYAEVDHYFFPDTRINCSVNIIKDLLHIELNVSDYWLGAAHPGYYWINLYVNIQDGRNFEIDHLFKSPEDARRRLSEKVNEAARKLNEESYDYYDTVEPHQIRNFQLGKDGLTVYFSLYEIAPYAAGIPEFYIPYTEIMDLIDTEGDFWKSFH